MSLPIALLSDKEYTRMTAMTNRIVTALSIVLVLFVARASLGVTWDLTADWSDAVNPNDVWSFERAAGVLMENTGPQTPDCDSATPNCADVGLFGGKPPQPAWAPNSVGTPGDHLPIFVKSRADSLTPAMETQFETGRVYVHANDQFNSAPPYQSSVASIIWTSPIHGQVAIDGGIFIPALNDPGDVRTVTWSIVVNAATVTGDEIQSNGPYNSLAPRDFADGVGGASALVQHVAAGDTIAIQFLPNSGQPSTFAGTSLSIRPVPTGDFDGDGDWDIDDVNDLLAVGPIAPGVPAAGTAQFDLNFDGIIDLDDLDEWLALAAGENGFASPYLLGDANLDGTVDEADFRAWNGNKFSQSLQWDNADFNGDGFVDGVDLLAWNANKFISSDVAAVSEPGSLLLTGWVWLGVVAIRKSVLSPQT